MVFYCIDVVVIHSISHVQLFATPWTATHQASQSLTISWILLKLMSTELVMPSNHLVLCHSLLLLSLIYPNIRIFSIFLVSQLFTSSGQSIGASISASVLPVNIQDLFPLGLTGLILQSTGLSRVFPAPQFENISSSVLSLLYGSVLTSIHDYWKNHSFDSMDLCQQSDVSAF